MDKLKAREVLEKRIGGAISDEDFNMRFEQFQETVITKTPERYKKSLSSDVPKEILAKLPLVSDEKNGMYIWGGVGTGKTHALYAMKKYFGEVCMVFTIKNFSELVAEIKSSFGSNDQLDILEERFIAYDDIGAEKESEWVGEQMYRLVNFLYENKRAFVFTSNLPLGELASRFGIQGDRIVSRIAEMANVIELKGTDRRI